MKINKHIILLIILLISSPSNSEQEKLSITVNVNGAVPEKGQAILSLFISTESYLNQPEISKTKPINNRGEVVFKLINLDPGTYAISIIYDEDNNNKLNTGFLGIPNELVGFSNNAKGTFGPPSYEDVSFYLSESKTIDIVLGKVKD